MKTALITGANKSIGFEVAQQLLQAGYYVYLGSRDSEKGEQAVAKFKSQGLDQVEVIQIDVSNSATIHTARVELGNKITSLDVLINNAGIRGEGDPSASFITPKAIRDVFNTNFFGTIEMTQAFLDLLRASDAPRIVNVTSGLTSLTLHSDPNWKYYKFKGAAYGPSKTALNAYTIALAFELRDTPFKINAVDPGYTATDFNQHQGTGTVEDAAARIVKYATIGQDGPTGGFFSDDNNPETGVSPW
ncbi:SDR family oxidoreductase [Mucilaginibacter ginsenosidivorans]|uniref:SDR family oxidoreductase n=1 Tax=Mucilaginibacter ginsenosidivorans TaxID=398053 RepID=A0A5B8UXR0_9SPHI|nr:SDR family oxidoreductase [Mucilaginibacter ginsenosidivorans]QEC63824.1 SDR family oxidoreductase [Mucilaginibacter ginsenosidivorans]